MIFGGIARLPHGESIPVKGLNLQEGEVYGCMGETLLLGLEEKLDSFSIGNISGEQVEWIGSIANRHGFRSVSIRQSVSAEDGYQEKTTV